MAVISAWHSAKADVHHNNSRCGTGTKNIDVANIRNGDGGKPLCQQCDELTWPALVAAIQAAPSIPRSTVVGVPDSRRGRPQRTSADR